MASNVNSSHLALSCLQCKQNHEIAECPQFGMKKREDKTEFIYSHRLCFGCLQANHIVKYCKGRKVCKKCQRLHPTALHSDGKELNIPTLTSGHLASSGGAKLQVVPVRVTLFGVTALTSAFLDSGSTHSFISGTLLERLGAQPAETTSVTLSTISADTKLQTCVVSHVIVEDLEYNNRLELPPLFVLSRIPVSNEDSPNAKDVDSWP